MISSYKILIAIICCTSLWSITVFGQTVDEIHSHTVDFMNTLSPDQLQEATYPMDDTLRTKWTNLPVGLAPRPGIRYGDLSTQSRIKFHHILTTLFSSQGYLKTTSIMQLDDILNELYTEKYKNKEIDKELYQELMDLDWAYGNYYISIWGKPEKNGTWGLKFGGHHISLNLTVSGNNFSMTPLFLGTDPAEVHSTQYAGLRVLSKEEDYGFRLINSLSDEQKSIATLSVEVPGDIITNPSNKSRLIDYSGIKANQLNEDQKKLLKMLIMEYINNLEHEKAHAYAHKIDNSGIDNIYFAWIGSYEPLKPHYYVINGPDFLIEYDNVGFSDDPGNHIHSIWREKGNDFGEDVLKSHYEQHKH